MVFSIVNQLLQREFSAPSSQDWDTRRERDLGIKPSATTIENPIELAVAQSHWLTVTCYVEQIAPESLSLEPMLLAQVQQELTILNGFDPLEVYAASLEYLSMADEDDSDYEEELGDAGVAE
jgi:hypothetical protein